MLHCFPVTGCSARLTLTPDNVAVLQGTEATMKCGSDSSNTVLWRTLWNTSVGMRTIYTGNKIHPDFHSLYRISVIKGEVNLVVRATEATAKTYFCEEPHSSADSASAELIVLGEDFLLECHSLCCYSFVCSTEYCNWQLMPAITSCLIMRSDLIPFCIV